MELTVKQLAERLLPVSHDGDLDGLTRQLRHWTLGGILVTTGEVHVGAGRARKYAESEVYYAALAFELTRWRMPVGVSDNIVRMARTHGLAEAIADRGNVLLCIRLGNHPHEVRIAIGGYESVMGAIAKQNWTADFPSFLAIDLTSLLSPLRS